MNHKVILIQHQEELLTIIEYLNCNYEVIINFTLLPENLKIRMIDFLSGYILSFQGKRHKIEDNIYTFSK
jgi:FtsZ-interacting cell division protein YlmF